MERKILRGVLILLLILIGFILQTTVLKEIALADVVPNFLLILTISVAYIKGQNVAVATGFVCGILPDIMYSDIIGMKALLFMGIGFLAGYAHKIYDREDITFPVLLMIVGDFIYGVGYYVLHFLFRNRLNFPYYLQRRILPEMVYTVVFAIICYKLIQKLLSLFQDKQEDA